MQPVTGMALTWGAARSTFRLVLGIQFRFVRTQHFFRGVRKLCQDSLTADYDQFVVIGDVGCRTWMIFIVSGSFDHLSEQVLAWSTIFWMPFWAGGMWLLWMPWKALRQARVTTYVVASQRVIILVDGETRAVESLYPKDIQGLEVVDRASGFGDLSLRRFATYGESCETGFWATPRVREAEQAIEKLKRSAS